MFAEFPEVPTAPVCVPVAVVFELVVDHIELGSKPFSQVRVPTLTVGQPRMGSVRGDAHHTMASSMSTSSYGIWCMHRLFTFAFECRGVAAAYHYVSEDGLLVPIITLIV